MGGVYGRCIWEVCKGGVYACHPCFGGLMDDNSLHTFKCA